MAGDPNAGMSQPLRALLGETGAGGGSGQHRNKTDKNDSDNGNDSASTVRPYVVHFESQQDTTYTSAAVTCQLILPERTVDSLFSRHVRTTPMVHVHGAAHFPVSES